MSKFTDHLWQDLAREHGPTLALADRPEPGRAPLLRRPRVLAASTLGLAGAAAALMLALGAPEPLDGDAPDLSALTAPIR